MTRAGTNGLTSKNRDLDESCAARRAGFVPGKRPGRESLLTAAGHHRDRHGRRPLHPGAARCRAPLVADLGQFRAAALGLDRGRAHGRLALLGQRARLRLRPHRGGGLTEIDLRMVDAIHTPEPPQTQILCSALLHPRATCRMRSRSVRRSGDVVKGQRGLPGSTPSGPSSSASISGSARATGPPKLRTVPSAAGAT